MERAELIEKAIRELQDPPPRSLRIRPVNECKRLWASILMVGSSFLLMIAFVTYLLGIPLLANYYGSPAQANIVNLGIGHGRNTSYIALVDYFDGQEKATARINISSSAYSSLHIGQTVNIHFFRMFPGRPSMDISPPSLILVYLMLLVLLMQFVFIPLAIKQKRLLTYGRMTKGRVESIMAKQVKIRFDFEGNGYVSFAPKIYCGTNNQVNDEVVVLFDPDNPKKNMAYDPAFCLWVPERE